MKNKSIVIYQHDIMELLHNIYQRGAFTIAMDCHHYTTQLPEHKRRAASPEKRKRCNSGAEAAESVQQSHFQNVRVLSPTTIEMRCGTAHLLINQTEYALRAIAPSMVTRCADSVNFFSRTPWAAFLQGVRIMRLGHVSGLWMPVPVTQNNVACFQAAK